MGSLTGLVLSSTFLAIIHFKTKLIKKTRSMYSSYKNYSHLGQEFSAVNPESEDYHILASESQELKKVNISLLEFLNLSLYRKVRGREKIPLVLRLEIRGKILDFKDGD